MHTLHTLPSPANSYKTKREAAAATNAAEAAISPYDKEALQKSRDLAEIRKNIRRKL